MTSASNTIPDLIPRPTNPEPQPLPPPKKNKKTKQPKQPKQPKKNKKTPSQEKSTTEAAPVPLQTVSGQEPAEQQGNRPEVDGRPSTIDILEEAANQMSRNTTLRPADKPANQSTGPGPLNGLHESLDNLVPKKSRKRLRTHEEDGRPSLPAPLPLDELMTHSVAELVAEARKRSKGAMSESDRAFFFNYFEEQRKMMVVKAIEREVSMEMVDVFL
jgi:hypothetical protein